MKLSLRRIEAESGEGEITLVTKGTTADLQAVAPDRIDSEKIVRKVVACGDLSPTGNLIFRVDAKLTRLCWLHLTTTDRPFVEKVLFPNGAYIVEPERDEFRVFRMQYQGKTWAVLDLDAILYAFEDDELQGLVDLRSRVALMIQRFLKKGER